jgi:hypothetical protein
MNPTKEPYMAEEQSEKLVDVPSVLPLVDGRPARELMVKFSGGVILDLIKAEHRRVLEALTLDHEVDLTLAIPGLPEMTVGCVVSKMETKHVKRDGSYIIQLARQVKVDAESTAWAE